MLTDVTLHERLKQKVGSNRKAAARLFPEWKKKARKEVEREKNPTTETALANKLGTLSRNGDATGWWRERPVLRRLLEKLVELEPHEIFETPGSALASTFREFPALPPLTGHEAPCRTSREGSVFELACAAVSDSEKRRHWIVVPPGGGKSLSIELLRTRFPGMVTALTVVRLGDAVQPALQGAGRSIVVEVEESDPVRDLASLRALEGHQGSVVVLAPFRHPDERITEWRSSLPESTPRGWNGTWATSHAAPDGGWIPRMLEWVESRLEASRKTHFKQDQVLAWLHAHPAVLRALESPGDLLALCADFDAYGGRGAPEDRAERWLRSIGARALPEEAPHAWATYAAADCVTTMAVAHALDRTTALEERSFAGWSALVPSSASPSENTPGSEHAVGLLRAAGLLRAGERGVTLFPTWVAGRLVQRRLVQLMQERAVHVWGAIAGDASRQSLVDDALDAITPNELRTLGESVLASMTQEAVTFAEVAALEALVAAFGRRLVRDRPEAPHAELAKRALTLQLAHLVVGASTGECRIPTTRRKHDEWFLSGWAISLATTGSHADVPTDLRWVLPGWSSNLLLSEAKPRNHLPSAPPWGASEAVQGLIALAPKIVARLVLSDVPNDVPKLLLPALILAGGWEVTEEHFAQLAGSWEETLLAEAVESLDRGRRASLATLLWRFASAGSSAIAPAPVAERIALLESRHTPLLRFVLGNLPATVVEETARTAGTHRRQHSAGSYTPSDPRALRQLSFEQRAAAVRGRLSNAVQFDEVRELVEVLDGEDLDVILDIIRAADPNVAAEFANRVWCVLPERAAAEAKQAFHERLAATEAWFRTAPRARIGVLVSLLDETSVRPAWVREWALAKVLDAGIHAESLFRLIRPEAPEPPAGRSNKPRKKPAR